MDKEPEKAESESAPDAAGLQAEVTYEEARALSAPAVPEEAQIESAQPETGSVTAPPARGRPRKGKESGTRWTCPLCGKNLSSGTKSHVCRPCTKENTPPAAPGGQRPAALEIAAPPAAPGGQRPAALPPVASPSAEPLPQPLPITLDDVTNFLYGEVRARRNARRERISAQMF